MSLCLVCGRAPAAGGKGVWRAGSCRQVGDLPSWVAHPPYNRGTWGWSMCECSQRQSPDLQAASALNCNSSRYNGFASSYDAILRTKMVAMRSSKQQATNREGKRKLELRMRRLVQSWFLQADIGAMRSTSPLTSPQLRVRLISSTRKSGEELMGLELCVRRLVQG